MLAKGKLVLVPTPIGNLQDITLRAIEVLKNCDEILAEDTRTSGKLLKHLGIENKLTSYHAHNEHRELERIVKKIADGRFIALVSDAGTPGISDPGFLLVRECLKNEIEIECLPGPTALIPALVKSGLPSDRFCFEGFLPLKKGRQTRLIDLKQETRTMVFYESPHRLIKTLNEFAECFGNDRLCSVSRELSKMFEETINGTLADAIAHFTKAKILGEFVIVVKGYEE